ncbi:MAG: hypothetical protein GY931_05965 [Maribacter sp.]|nr:hypothetical protein [Maribacter sp.]
MPDIATIGAALSSLKTATDIAKFLRASDFNLKKAELKLKMADLVSALAEAKMELVDVQEEILEKDKVITELKEAFESKDQLVRRYDAYYEADSNGAPVGISYCLRCWEGDHKKRQLVCDSKDRMNRTCTSCGQRYEGRRSSEIIPPKEPES